MKLMTTALLSVLAAAPAPDDWPQYRGPRRDDVSAEKGLLQQWPVKGPPLLWTFENAGLGYSGPTDLLTVLDHTAQAYQHLTLAT